ncbi:MAG: TonB-dependent receptor [Bacteroidales bacterium]|nr:TonB-dependent receptor [Bacteroidales bacterium]
MKRLLYTLSCVILPGLHLYAADTLPDSNDSTLNYTRTLPELNVKSQKVEKSISSAVPIHVLSSKDMEERGVTNISDALLRLPGVNLRDYGGAGGLKTVSVRGLGAQHTGVSYDGVMLTDARSGEIDLSRYSLNTISSLSLTSGDNSDIFIPARNAASASTLSLSTIAAPEAWKKALKGKIKIKGGDFGMINPSGEIGYSNGSNFNLNALVDYFHAKNNYKFLLKNGDFSSHERRNHSRMNSIHTELTANYLPTPSSSLSGKLYFYGNSRLLPGPVIYYAAEGNESLKDRNFFGQLKYRNKLSSIFSVSALGKFNFAGNHYEDIDGKYPGGRLDQKYIQREVYSSASLLCLPARSWAMDYSMDWWWNNLSSNLPSNNHPYRHSILQSLSASYKKGAVAAMVRLLYSIYLDKAAGQGIEIDKRHSRLSPAVSVNFRPFTVVPFYLRASYKNIFRMPTFNELYFDNYGTVELRPEITDQWNVGMTFSLPESYGIFKSLDLTVDGYLNKVKDKIVAIPYNLFKWTMTNLGKARIYGLDVTLNTEIGLTATQSLTGALTYSYQRAQPRTSPDMIDWMKQIAYTPLNSGSVSISWLNPWVSIVLSGRGSSARYTTSANLPSTRLPGYAEFGTSLFHEFKFKAQSLEIRAEVSNIFNKQYEVVARYPMPGRAWTASLSYSF